MFKIILHVISMLHIHIQSMLLIISVYVTIDGSSYGTCNESHFDPMLL